MKTDIESLILSGQVLQHLATLLESEGEMDQAISMYQRALIQGLIIRELKAETVVEPSVLR